MAFFLQILFLIAPVVVAGLAHVVVLKLNLFSQLTVPLDFGSSVHGARIFGDNKTWRGVVIMAVGAAIVMAIQAWLFSQSAAVRTVALFDYNFINPWISGALFGLGYSLGELPNSFIKRRLGISPGQHPHASLARKGWYLIDQADSVIGSLIAMRYFFPASFTISLICFIVGVAIHVLVDHTLYMLKMKS